MRERLRIPIVATAALFVAACTGAPGPTPGPTATPPPAGATDAPPADACNPPRQDGVTLTFVSFGGAYQEAQRKGWLEPYSALTGVEFQEDENSSNATIKAQVESGQVTWDVVDVGNDFGLESHAALLEPLDYSLIPRDQLVPGLGDSEYRVPDITYGVALAYNTAVLGAGNVPQGWADYFDTAKFPGKRGMWDYSEGGIFEIALMADGVAPADLYPLDLERAAAKLDTIRDDLVFWSSGAESQELIGSGEVAMTLIWNGRGWSAKHVDGKPVEIQWNQQILTADYLVVPKGTPNKEAAMRFIAYAICAENNGKPSQYIPYGPTNKNAEADPKNVADLAVTNANETTAYFDDVWLIENYDMVEAAYQAWKAR